MDPRVSRALVQGRKGKERCAVIGAATSRIWGFNCTQTATRWQHPPPSSVDAGVDMAATARREVKTSKCLALPPPQGLLSGSEQSCLQPQTLHSLRKPPGKKERGGPDSCLPVTQERQRSHFLPAPGVLHQHHTPHDCQACNLLGFWGRPPGCLEVCSPGRWQSAQGRHPGKP